MEQLSTIIGGALIQKMGVSDLFERLQTALTKDLHRVIEEMPGITAGDVAPSIESAIGDANLSNVGSGDISKIVSAVSLKVRTDLNKKDQSHRPIADERGYERIHYPRQNTGRRRFR